MAAFQCSRHFQARFSPDPSLRVRSGVQTTPVITSLCVQCAWYWYLGVCGHTRIHCQWGTSREDTKSVQCIAILHSNKYPPRLAGSPVPRSPHTHHQGATAVPDSLRLHGSPSSSYKVDPTGYSYYKSIWAPPISVWGVAGQSNKLWWVEKGCSSARIKQGSLNRWISAERGV